MEESEIKRLMNEYDLKLKAAGLLINTAFQFITIHSDHITINR